MPVRGSLCDISIPCMYDLITELAASLDCTATDWEENITCCNSTAREFGSALCRPYQSASTPTHWPSRRRAWAVRRVEGKVGAKKTECLIAERTWKYASVPMMAKQTIVSIGENTARRVRGRRGARMLKNEWTWS